VSIAANVAHSYVPPENAPADWSPPLGAVVGAVFWPVALFVAVEILARVAWPAGTRWWALRFAGLLPVAVVAAVVSYGHLSGLLAFYGEADWTAAIGPLAVDGLMVMATAALIATGARRTAEPTAEPTTETAAGPAFIAAVPADPPAMAAPGPAPVAAPAAAADTTAEPAPTAPAASTPAPSPVAKPARTRARSTRKPPSADKVAKAAARMPGATVAAIAARAGVSESTARRYLPTARPSEPAARAAAAVASATPPRPAPTPALADAA
jgi:hypothetical protein